MSVFLPIKRIKELQMHAYSIPSWFMPLSYSFPFGFPQRQGAGAVSAAWAPLLGVLLMDSRYKLLLTEEADVHT